MPLSKAFTAPILIPTVLVNLIPFVAVSLLVPAYRAAKASKSIKLQLQRIKHNPEIFEALLARQRSIVKSTDGLGIVLGNPNATVRIVKVCNPYCPPCSESHKTIEELLDNNPDLQIQEKGEEKFTREALDTWYLRNTSKNYDMFAQMYPVNGELQKQSGKVKGMQDWCMATGIEGTPTFFVNGHQVPESIMSQI